MPGFALIEWCVVSGVVAGCGAVTFWWRGAVMAVCMFASGVAFAQPDGGVVEEEPRVRVVRPEEGSWRRGVLPVPGWVPLAAGAVVVIAAAGLLVWRARRSK